MMHAFISLGTAYSIVALIVSFAWFLGRHNPG